TNPEVIGYRNDIERTTSFFFTNFPEETTTLELWNIFRSFWRVGEVYIPNKRDKAGKRFGFARFEDVEDQQKLLQKIEETWIGTYKIRANLPKFRRGEASKSNFIGDGGRKQGANARIVQSKGQTFKEVVQGVNNLSGGGKKLPTVKHNEWFVKAKKKGKSRLTEEEYRAGVMEIEVESENLKQLEGSFVGTLNEIADVHTIQ
ncbi:RNA-binding protein 25-like, partial [Trifolium medium]|nr:RNA-binding protein 25-like [Trifolium medium]